VRLDIFMVTKINVVVFWVMTPGSDRGSMALHITKWCHNLEDHNVNSYIPVHVECIQFII